MKKISNNHLNLPLCSTLFTLCAFLVLPVSATSYNANTSQKTYVEEQNIERIQVTGQRPVIYFQRAMMEAENDFYKLYSQLTQNHEFKTKCSKLTPTGTRIKQRICTANFI